MKTIYTAIILLLFTCIYNSFSQNEYNYNIDLINVIDDKVNVELIPPKIKRNKINFYFAKIIPGTYQVYDFGRFISNFKAYDNEGKLMEVTRQNENTFLIKNAKEVRKITYQVDDTYDLKEGKKVSGMSGTNIEVNKNFVLNGHGFYGYFEGMQFLPYHINIKKPENFKGSSAINPVETSSSYEKYTMPNFNFVVDTPMMFCEPDITSTQVANAEVIVSVYSPSGNVKSKYLSDKLKDLLEGARNYIGEKLPVDKYAFIMYFLDPSQNVGTGALEHNYSSLYALPDLPQEQILQPILNISAHEFFHIITPLNIHSKEIQYFDFNDPKMSKHLWLYEGVTEYFAHHAQLKSGLIDLDTFLNEMASKITDSKTNYNDNLAFTELSKGSLNAYRNQYGNVYQKGALIGLCLDILLRKDTNGDKGLIELMKELSLTYGKNKPFNDNRLFHIISESTSNNIKSYFKNYVSGNKPLPLSLLFNDIGVSYSEPKPYMGYSLGSPGLGYNPDKKRIYVADISNLNEFGKKIRYEVGDELLKINGKLLPQNGFQKYFQGITANLKENETLTIEVERDGKIKLLTTTVEKVQKYQPAKLVVNKNATNKQTALREKWINN